MNVLIDTDVLLDVALDRKRFVEPALRLLDLLERMPSVAAITER